MKPLTPERWQQIKPLLYQLHDLPPEARPAFLEQASQGDPTLHEQLLAALDANREGPPVLKGIDSQHFAAMLRDFIPGDLSDASSPDGPPFIGRHIGPYKVVGEIAHGGMGAVLLAERADGVFDRQVALKVIRDGHSSREIDRRFLAERRILAQLRHEHIARLLDGGMTESGQPYFVMEYIDGEPITTYCDARQLGVEERLRLFQDVCEAVQYAHSNLVVHRDLKPSNILVTRDGKVKLLDFGIAKLLRDEPDEETALTRTGLRLMTPEYAAPEQVRGEAVTTATDVYSLGVLLYELLTGHKPYRLTSHLRAELERVICEVEPESPSTVVSRMVEREHPDGMTEPVTPEAVSQARDTHAERLQRRLRGDLDKMVLKALRKEPERRYVSAEAFLEDIRRHLAGLPVKAQKDTLGYRAHKFIRRHRMGVAAATAFAILLITVAIFTTVQARRIAVEAAKSDQVKEFVVSLFEVSDPDNVEPRDITAQELLARGVERMEELADQPEVQAEMLHVLGVVYRQLGKYEKAQPLLERALALRKSLHGEKHVDVAYSMYELGLVLEELGRFDEAELLYRKALKTQRNLLGDEHEEVAKSLNELGWVLLQKGLFDESEKLLRESLAMRENLFGYEHTDIAESLNFLAVTLSKKGAFDEAERLHRKTLDIKQKLYGNEHPEIARSLNNLAIVLEKKDQYAEAEKLHREALRMRRKLLGNEHPLIALDMDNLAVVLRQKGDYDEAERLNRDALHLWRKLLGAEHPDVAISMANLAMILYYKGEYEEAELLYREALAMQRKLLSPQHARTATTLFRLSRLLVDQNRSNEAEPFLREALDIRVAVFSEAHQSTTEAKRLLAICLSRLARYAEAERLLHQSLAFYHSQGLEKEIESTRQALTDLYTAREKPEQAATYKNALAVNQRP